MASSAWAATPLAWDGNNHGSFVYNSASAPFTRMAWIQWPVYDEYGVPIGYETFRCDTISMRFTANASGTAAATQMYVRALGNKSGYNDPQVTASIQTDAGSGSPSGTIVGGSGSATLPIGTTTTGGSGYSGTITVPLSAAVTEGTTYHLVLSVDNMTASNVLYGGDYANSDVDFRLVHARGNGGTTLDNKIRLYDGTEDANMMCLYYNYSGSTWREGEPDSYSPLSPGGHKFNVRAPAFEMFSDAGATTGIGGLAEGTVPALCPVIRKGIHLSSSDTDTLVAEKVTADYPNAAPVAKTIRIIAGKYTSSGSETDWPENDLALEVRNSSNVVVATATVAAADIQGVVNFGDSYPSTSDAWIEAELDQDVALVDGETYYVVAKNATASTTSGRYVIAMNENRGVVIPTEVNSYMGLAAVVAESSDNGATWTEDDTVDLPFALGIVIPGDANGDGQVSVGDLGILGANYNQGIGKDWDTADFTGDGEVKVGDLGILGAHYGESLGRWAGLPDATIGAGAVPEPATLSLLAVGALALIRRKRK
jgi:hypothetical protein